MQYNLSWALGVVKTYLECYPRATEITNKALGLSSKDLALCIAKTDCGWANYKAIVKLVDMMLERRHSSGTPVGNSVSFVNGVIAWGVSHGRIRNRKLLTDEPFNALNEKHVSTGVPGEAKPIQGPSFFPPSPPGKEVIEKWTIGEQLELPFGNTTERENL